MIAEHVKREWSDIIEKKFSFHIANENRITNIAKTTVKGDDWGYWGQKWYKFSMKLLVLDFVTNWEGWLLASMFKGPETSQEKFSEREFLFPAQYSLCWHFYPIFRFQGSLLGYISRTTLLNSLWKPYLDSQQLKLILSSFSQWLKFKIPHSSPLFPTYNTLQN